MTAKRRGEKREEKRREEKKRKEKRSLSVISNVLQIISITESIVWKVLCVLFFWNVLGMFRERFENVLRMLRMFWERSALFLCLTSTSLLLLSSKLSHIFILSYSHIITLSYYHNLHRR